MIAATFSWTRRLSSTSSIPLRQRTISAGDGSTSISGSFLLIAFLLPVRMGLLYLFAQMRHVAVRVNCCGRKAGVSEQLLNSPEVRSAFKQVCGVGMPEHIRGDFSDSRL